MTTNGNATPHVIDMRSDTVTKPTPNMRTAMAQARVGDDVYGDDPTVNELEAKVARLLGKEAGLFVPSGTMGNLIAVLTHCSERGSEYIVGELAHIHRYEQGGTATLGGVHPHTILNKPDGTLPIAEIKAAIRGDDIHFPITRLICLETTQNKCGGRILSKEYIDQVGQLAHEHGLQLHIDGARLMNAVVATGIPASTMVSSADSVSLCLSKGLAAPIGSVLVGTTPFITKARRLRKALGGGMRQVGVIAAPALIALDEMIDRLSIDHTNAKKLAVGLQEITGITVDVEGVETNIVIAHINSNKYGLNAFDMKLKLKENNILMNAMSEDSIRFVTHYEIKEEDIEKTIEIVKLIQKNNSK